jgi:hypothetical protein
MKKVVEALADGEKCIEIKPDWAKGYGRKGAAQEALGNLKYLKLAIETYDAGLKLDAGNSWMLAAKERATKKRAAAAKARAKPVPQAGRKVAPPEMGYQIALMNGMTPAPYIVLKSGGGGGGVMIGPGGIIDTPTRSARVGLCGSIDTHVAAVEAAASQRDTLRAELSKEKLTELDEALFIKSATGDAKATFDLLLLGASPLHTANYAEGTWYYSTGHTALFCACRNGFVEPCRLLLAAGAEVNATNTDGYYGGGWRWVLRASLRCCLLLRC